MRVLLCAAVAAVSLLSSPVGAAISEDLVFCSKLTAPKERLACYDAAARIERQGAIPTARHQSTAPRSVRVPRPVDASASSFHWSAPVPRPFAGTYVFAFGGYTPGLGHQDEFALMSLSGAGVGIGYNFMSGGMMFGLEARAKNEFGGREVTTFALSHHAALPFEVRRGCCLPAPLPVTDVQLGSDIRDVGKWTAGFGGDVSARVGAAAGDWLVFARAGVGLQRLDTKSTEAISIDHCVNPVFQREVGPGGSFRDIVVGCGSVRTDTTINSFGYGGASLYGVFGLGLEHNFGPFFARAEAEFKSYFANFQYVAGRPFALPNFYTVSANAAIGYRF